MLYEIGKDGKAQDALAAEEDRSALRVKELKKRTKLDSAPYVRDRYLGHPKGKLQPLMRSG